MHNFRDSVIAPDQGQVITSEFLSDLTEMATVANRPSLGFTDRMGTHLRKRPQKHLRRFVLKENLYACDLVGVIASPFDFLGSRCAPRSEEIRVTDPVGTVRGSLLATYDSGTGQWFMPVGTSLYAVQIGDAGDKWEAVSFGYCECGSSSSSDSSSSYWSDSSYWNSGSIQSSESASMSASVDESSSSGSSSCWPDEGYVRITCCSGYIDPLHKYPLPGIGNPGTLQWNFFIQSGTYFTVEKGCYMPPKPEPQEWFSYISVYLTCNGGTVQLFRRVLSGVVGCGNICCSDLAGPLLNTLGGATGGYLECS